MKMAHVQGQVSKSNWNTSNQMRRSRRTGRVLTESGPTVGFLVVDIDNSVLTEGIRGDKVI
jgi:hypothetical protein